MDPIKHHAAYERMDVLRRIADERRIARAHQTPIDPPAERPRPAPAGRRERCPDDLAQPRPA